MPDLTNPLSQEGLERIAAGLTDAQRRALDWADTEWRYPTSSAECALAVRGILEQRFNRRVRPIQPEYRITELGLRLRSHLLKGHEHG